MKKFLVLLPLLFLASAAEAQVNTAGPCPANTNQLQVNPTYICVIPPSVSAHNLNDPLNSQTIAHYNLLFFAPGVDPASGNAVQTINVGKPTLNPAGVFWLQRSELTAIPVGQRYTSATVAVNAAGQVSGRSPASDPFGRSTAGVPDAPRGTAVVP